MSSSANHIFDITVGFASDSALSRSNPPSNAQQEKKINIYNQMAQVLVGHDETGSIRPFDEDGNILAGGDKIREAIFLCFSRLLVKDEIKKGSFTLQLGTGSYNIANNGRITIADAGAQNDFRINSPAGEYGILSVSAGQAVGSADGKVGLIYYQAGVVVLTASIFTAQPIGQSATDVEWSGAGGDTITASFTGSQITSSADYLRHRIYDIQFNNTTELNSTIYFCRLGHNEFNYSSNPSYLSGSKIRTKNLSTDAPSAYFSGIALMSSDNAVLGVAKLSEIIKKDSSNSLTIRVRNDW